jgi:hypothetical protein
MVPNTRVRLVGKTRRAKSYLANFGDCWTAKHPTGSRHEGVFLVADGPKFEAFWLSAEYDIVETTIPGEEAP